MLKFIPIFILALCSLTSYGQQEPMYSQFFSNKIVVNPAYAGTRNAVSFVGIYRNQWTGLEGSPQTATLSVHGTIPKFNSGLGLSIVYDQIGIQRNYSLKAAYAYHIKTRIGVLSFGIDGQVRRQAMSWEDVNPLDLEDEDIPYGQNALSLPNFGAGIYLQKEKYFVGFSVPQLLQNKLDYDPFEPDVEGLQKRHYFAMAGGLIPVSETIQVKTSALFRYARHAPIGLDINAMCIIRKAFMVGGTYRWNDSFDVILQYQLKNSLRIGYAYDFTLTKLTRAASGSHEIMVGFDLNKKEQGIYHPRYF